MPIEGSPQVIALHPPLIADDFRHVAARQEALLDFGRSEGETGERLVAASRALIGAVHPGLPRQGFHAEIRGRFSERIGDAGISGWTLE